MQLCESLPPQMTPCYQLMAPVGGLCSALQDSPRAIDQLQLLGPGVSIAVRTQRLLAPARCKVARISPCRREWLLQLKGGWLLLCKLDSPQLPVAFSQVTTGQIVHPGDTLATLAPIHQHPHLRVLLQVAKAPAASAAQAFYHQVQAGVDPVLTLACEASKPS